MLWKDEKHFLFLCVFCGYSFACDCAIFMDTYYIFMFSFFSPFLFLFLFALYFRCVLHFYCSKWITFHTINRTTTIRLISKAFSILQLIYTQNNINSFIIYLTLSIRTHNIFILCVCLRNHPTRPDPKTSSHAHKKLIIPDDKINNKMKSA